ncbi:hypothetical protein pipiens_007957 [Culex pipiens pipiens]|uniref:HMG box domain-containing protein n=1 Tax=Culex pipiens pipiens TaxID=38569 RepID=A0ABD1DKP1_CULPP
MAPASQEPKTTSRNNPRSTEERPTRNPYFNFLKDFRRENRDLNPNEVVRQGAEEWNQLSDAQRRPFVLEAMNQPPMERVRRARGRAAPRSRSPRRRRSQARWWERPTSAKIICWDTRSGDFLVRLGVENSGEHDVHRRSKDALDPRNHPFPERLVTRLPELAQQGETLYRDGDGRVYICYTAFTSSRVSH